MENKQIVGYEIHTLDNMIGRIIKLLIEKNGITQMQSWIINYLYDHPEEDVFQKDLESQFRIARSTATGILKLMEKKELLRREPVPSDARLKRLVLTEKGIGKKLAIIRSLDEIETLLKDQISQDELDTFFSVIHQMKRNIEHRQF